MNHASLYKCENHYGYLPLICIFNYILPNCRIKLRKQLILTNNFFWFWFTHMYRHATLLINTAKGALPLSVVGNLIMED